MATYYGTYGQKVQYLASDPSDPQIGQVWYNSTSAILKVRAATTTGTWASGGNMNTARYGHAVSGTQTSALAFGGALNPGITAASESYNGTSWTNTPSLNTARYYIGGCGTQTSSLGFGGYAPGKTDATELWNGTSWTSNPTGLNTSRFGLSGVGIQTAALAIGGDTYPPVPTRTSAAVESFNGTSWTSTTSLNTARRLLGAAGTNTASIAFGGFIDFPNSISTASESWNGTSWTNTASLPIARWGLGSAGTQTAALGFAGGADPSGGPPNNVTLSWNGSVWSTLPATLATSRSYSSGTGSQTAALAAGGYTVPANVVTAATEEWTGPGVAQTQTVTVS